MKNLVDFTVKKTRICHQMFVLGFYCSNVVYWWILTQQPLGTTNCSYLSSHTTMLNITLHTSIIQTQVWLKNIYRKIKNKNRPSTIFIK